jgi:hypothetical protein
MATAVETRRDVEAASEAVSRPRLPGLFLGIGLGGFVDGIVLHQILQWHHMLTSEGDYPKTTVAGLETNTRRVRKLKRRRIRGGVRREGRDD